MLSEIEKMNLLKRIFTFSFYIFSISNLLGDNLNFSITDNSQFPYNLTSNIKVLEDTSTNLTFNDILLQQESFKTIKNNAIAFNFSFTSSAIWLKSSLTNNKSTPIDLFLEIQYPRLMDIYLYLGDGEKYKMVHSGYSVPLAKRPHKSRYFTFPIRLEANHTYNIFLRVTSPNSITIPVYIWDISSYHTHDINDHAFQAIYFGIIFAMVAYNLLIFIFLKDTTYLLYVIFIINTGLGIAAFNGIAGEWIWGDNPFLEQISANLWVTLTGCSLILFMRKMLNAKIDTPRLDIINKLAIFIQILFLTLILLDYKKFVIPLLITLLFITIWITLYSIIRAFQKNRAAYFFVSAFIFLLIAVALGNLRALGIIPTNPFTSYGVQISSAVQMIVLAIALADRYNTMKQEKEEAEALVQENLRKSNLELEEKVKERTYELNKTLYHIKEDLSLAKKIQMNSLYINPKLIQGLNINIKYIPMTEVGGDFYDISKLSETSYRIFIADATGHGVQAAMITMVIKGIYDNVKGFNLKTNEIIEIFNNEFVHKYVSLNSYLTAIVLDIDLKHQTLTYVSAGHPSGILISNGEIIELKRTGKIIGVFKNVKYQSQTLPYFKDDKLFIFTDGIFEEFNNKEEEFGEMRLHDIIQRNQNKSLSDIIDIVLNELENFLEQKEKQDDITIMGIEYPV